MPVTTHKLKCLPDYFKAVRSGLKTFEVRKNDRGFMPGHLLVLQEYHPATGYTGDYEPVEVTYVLEGGQFGLSSDYVVMSIKKTIQF